MTEIRAKVLAIAIQCSVLLVSYYESRWLVGRGDLESQCEPLYVAM